MDHEDDSPHKEEFRPSRHSKKRSRKQLKATQDYVHQLSDSSSSVSDDDDDDDDEDEDYSMCALQREGPWLNPFWPGSLPSQAIWCSICQLYC